MMNGRQILIALAIKYSGNWDEIYGAILSKDIQELEQYYQKFENSLCKATTLLDKDYPQILKHIYMPPFVLFYYGDITLTHNPSKCLSIIGSRNPTEYGSTMAYNLSKDLSNDFVIVSGLAKGIDGISHQAAVDAGNKTIGIIGGGFDNFYPTENTELFKEMKTHHLVLSEYFEDVASTPKNFPLRNRIIAGLSKATLIVEAQRQSGTSITASYALSFSRTVLAVPNRADTNSACNRLIKEGAILVECAKDVIDELNQTAFVGTEIQENC